MPVLSPSGRRVGMGRGDGRQTDFLSDDQIIRQECDGGICRLQVLDVPTGIVVDVNETIINPAWPRHRGSNGPDGLRAGNGRWAAWLAGGDGYRDSAGRHLPNWFPLAICDDGSNLICRYDRGGDIARLTANNRATTDEEIPILVPGALDRSRASESGGDFVYCQGGRLWLFAGGKSWPSLVYLQDARYADGVLVGHGSHGLVVFPWGEPTRGIVLAADGLTFNPDIKLRNDGRFAVVASRTAGEGAGDCRAWIVDVLDEDGPTIERCDVVGFDLVGNGQPVKVKPTDLTKAPAATIGRRIWFGWFVFSDEFPKNGAYTRTAPGNCWIRVVQPTPGREDEHPGFLEVLDSTTGRVIFRYCSGAPDGDPAAVQKAIDKAAGGGLGRIAYWTRKNPTIPNCEVQGVEAYWQKTETEAEFEKRVRDRIALCRFAWPIFNCYTSNLDNITDLERVVPVMKRIARDCQNVIGVCMFSDGGRASGYLAHPEVVDDYEEAFSGVTGTGILVPESVVPPIDPPKPPKPPEPPKPPIEPEEDMRERKIRLRLSGQIVTVEPGGELNARATPDLLQQFGTLYQDLVALLLEDEWAEGKHVALRTHVGYLSLTSGATGGMVFGIVKGEFPNTWALVNAGRPLTFNLAQPGCPAELRDEGSTIGGWQSVTVIDGVTGEEIVGSFRANR